MNDFEKAVSKKYSSAGWTVLRSGWPDFLLIRQFKGNSVICGLEVKAHDDPVRPNQQEMLSALASHIPVICAGEDRGYSGGTNLPSGRSFCELLVRSELPDYFEAIQLLQSQQNLLRRISRHG